MIVDIDETGKISGAGMVKSASLTQGSGNRPNPGLYFDARILGLRSSRRRRCYLCAQLVRRRRGGEGSLCLKHTEKADKVFGLRTTVCISL